MKRIFSLLFVCVVVLVTAAGALQASSPQALPWCETFCDELYCNTDNQCSCITPDGRVISTTCRNYCYLGLGCSWE